MGTAGDTVKLGVALPVAGAWSTPENLTRVAQRAEALGYHSLWVFQRLLYPLVPKGDYPPAPGQPWPKALERVLDPIVTLAYVAAATRCIRLGTSVLIMPYYAPIVLAKHLTTLDILSGGRLNVGLGIGWSEDEYDAVGVPFRQRGRRADEFLRCLRAIWTDDVVEFRGEFYKVPPAKVEPKPIQKPHPPITLGGYGPVMIHRVVTLADGFSGGNVPLTEVTPLVMRVKTAAAAAGRDPATLHIVCRGTLRLYDAPQGPDRRPLFGTLEEIREDICRYAATGVTELFLEGNFDPIGATVDRFIDVMEVFAPSNGG